MATDLQSWKRWIPYRQSLRDLWNMIRPLPAIRIQKQSRRPKPSAYDSPVEPNNVLEQLGEKYKPSKRLHDYLKYYHLHLSGIRMQVRTVLEIGVDAGTSLAMWEDYFPNARIHGIDIHPACERSVGGRRQVHIGNAIDPTFLETVLASEPDGFDIVIDDGSHLMEDQLFSFNYLFPRLTSHGIYVIEDTGPCAGDYNSRVIARFAKMIRHVNYWPSAMPFPWPPDNLDPSHNWLARFPSQGHWGDRNIIGISFYRWMVFVHRGCNPQDNHFLFTPKE